MKYGDFTALFADARNELAYAADINTHEIIFMTKAAMKMVGIECEAQYRSKKCYQILQGLDAPCEFCTNSRLLSGECSVVWEQYNPIVKKWLRLEDFLFEFDGRYLRGEVATDISAEHSTISNLQRQLTREQVLARSIRTLALEPDAHTAVNLFLNYIGNYYQADRACIFELDYKHNAVHNTYEWCAPGIKSTMSQFQNAPIFNVAGWIANSKKDSVQQYSLNTEAGEHMEKILRSRGVERLMVTPLFKGETQVGFLGVDNVRASTDDPALLSLSAAFITEEFQKRQLVHDLAGRKFTDRLTGLPNRNKYLKTLEDYRCNPPRSLAVFTLDMDGLKELNEHDGHDYGDQFICRCADALREVGANAYRVDGDEFIILEPNISLEDAEQMEKRLRIALECLQPHSVSIGFNWNAGNLNVPAMVNEAYEHMFAEKQVYYRTAISRNREHRAGIATDILKEIQEGRYVVHYQPQVNLKTGAIFGAEALMRKLDGAGNIVLPDRFVPMYEASGVISHLDFHMLDLVCAQIRTWLSEFGKCPNISVNFSRRTLMEPGVVQRICSICEKHNIPAQQLTIEVTESTGKLSRRQLRNLVSELQQAGFSVSLDDFGSHHSNLSILTGIGFQIIKLDKSLIEQAAHEERGARILANLLQMCRETIQTPVIAEGVENREQLAILRALSCDYAQGYFFSRPVPSHEFADLLKNGHVYALADAILPVNFQRHEYELRETQLDRQDPLYPQEDFPIRLIKTGSDMCGYYIREKRAILPDCVVQKTGFSPIIENLQQWLRENFKLDQENARAMDILFERMHRGDTSGSEMLTLNLGNAINGRYWVRFNSFRDAEGEPYFAIISLDDFTGISHQYHMKDNDINGLLEATAKSFPELLTLNLSQGTYRIIQYDSLTTLGTPQEGRIEDMLRIRLGGVADEDRESFIQTFSMDHLKQAFLVEGRDMLQLAYRRFGKKGDIYWMESTVRRQQNSLDDDLLLVVMSRNIDAQKAEESRLREQLRIQAEEIRLTIAKMSKLILYYDIPGRVLSIPPAKNKNLSMPEVLPDFPNSLHRFTGIAFPAESKKVIQDYYESIQRGVPTGSCEYIFKDSSETSHWERLEHATIFDSQGKPLRAVIAVENVTAQRNQSAENSRLKANVLVLEQLARHSARKIFYYDPSTRMIRPHSAQEDFPWQDISVDALLESGIFHPLSQKEIQRILVEIHAGSPGGMGKILFKTKSQHRWLDVKYSTLPGENNAAATAIISTMDITDQYEHELAYLRVVQSLETDIDDHLLFIECDLTENTLEKLAGLMLPDEYRMYNSSFSNFKKAMIRRVFLAENSAKAANYFSREHLLQQFADGKNKLKSEWQVHFRDASQHWLAVEVTMITDPYTRHVKAFFHVEDITEEKQALLNIQHRAERDGMTGLLNRATAEDMIRKKIAETSNNGILIILDLDDLKGINDTYGHKEGDRAIMGIAEILKSHFRETDIIVRFGGDEFVIYLPGSADSSSAIALSITGLLRKLAGIAIGENDVQRIHCSVGCAVQTSQNSTFEELYRQADTALYHVKRSGKNNFAFYLPEMDQASFQFQAKQLFSRKTARKYEAAELHRLLQSIAELYQLVISVNLSANDYYLMEEIENGVFSNAPTFGVLDDFVIGVSRRVHPDDAEDFMAHLTRESLLQTYARGKKSLRHCFRFWDGENYRWTEATVVFYTNEVDCVCDFTLLRWMENPDPA